MKVLVKTMVALGLIMLLGGMPLMLTASRCSAADGSADYSQGADAGKASAKTGSDGWIVGGFCCGIFGIAGAALIAPTVPQDQIEGKSADYVKGFSDSYKSVRSKKNIGKAVTGCIVAIPVSLLISAMGSSN